MLAQEEHKTMDTKPSPTKVLEILKEGNLRFSEGKMIYPNLNLERVHLAGVEN